MWSALPKPSSLRNDIDRGGKGEIQGLNYNLHTSPIPKSGTQSWTELGRQGGKVIRQLFIIKGPCRPVKGEEVELEV